MSDSLAGRLLLIAQLKAELGALVQANKLTSTEYSRISQLLDESIRPLLPSRSLDDLLSSAQ